MWQLSIKRFNSGFPYNRINIHKGKSMEKKDLSICQDCAGDKQKNLIRHEELISSLKILQPTGRSTNRATKNRKESVQEQSLNFSLDSVRLPKEET